MDFNTLNLFRFRLHYLSYFVGSLLLGLPISKYFVEEGFRVLFWIGFFLSFGIQFALLELRFFARRVPSLSESGFPLFTVFLSFFLNLAVLAAILFLDFPFEPVGGFLIAYFLHLLFLVFASYFSGK